VESLSQSVGNWYSNVIKNQMCLRISSNLELLYQILSKSVYILSRCYRQTSENAENEWFHSAVIDNYVHCQL